MANGEDITRRQQLHALVRVAKYRPELTVAIVAGGVLVALLEGVGLSFILPIVEIVQSSGGTTSDVGGLTQVFVRAYQILGVPFELGYAIAGVSLVLTVRWTLTFVVRWLRSALVVDYIREIQTQSFDATLDAKVEYFDREGSDDILNAIVTQAEYAGRVIQYLVNFTEQGLQALIYLAVALYLSPTLTLFTIVVLGGFSLLFRYFVESGYELGDRVADANERLQQTAQAGTQGIRDAKLFGLKTELFNEFLDAVDHYASSSITQQRNEQAINNFYNLLTAISVFVLIYLAITFVDLSLGSLSVFLFAMFRLGPKASGLNSTAYQIENNLPHLVRTHKFIDDLRQYGEPSDASTSVPDEIRTVRFDDVRFAYEGQEDTALSGVSFEFERGEFVGVVGRSGAGKSTIGSLLVRMYEPDSGTILANGEPIHRMDLESWRSNVSVVRQDPFIFNDTLRYNLTIGNRDVQQSEIDQICRIAKVDEFLVDLSNGYETELGDDGVRLSGGQRQRIALARALLKDADILLLDEATSDLDSNLEKQVQDAIENMEREYAIISIAHRLSTVQNADRIYTVDDGEIIEMGSHYDLLERGGQYADLYTIQSEHR